jgi:hypothetical protein
VGALYVCSQTGITKLVVLPDPEILRKCVHTLDRVIICTNIYAFID